MWDNRGNPPTHDGLKYLRVERFAFENNVLNEGSLDYILILYFEDPYRIVSKHSLLQYIYIYYILLTGFAGPSHKLLKDPKIR